MNLDYSTLEWESQYKQVLTDVMHNGHVVTAQSSRSVGANKNSWELNNYLFSLSNMRDRIINSPIRKFNIISAIARFVWMVSGSDRLDEIMFYEPKVARFTDNHISVPGSNYGMRLFQPKPGLNQVEAVIQRLIEDAGSRRACATVWQPEDASRDSNDIPCTFNLSFYVRDGMLHATTVMRSNAAYTLLPFNVFEFTLLAELIAARVNADIDAHEQPLSLGSYTHFAVSMHVYEHEAKNTRLIIQEEMSESCSPMLPMPVTKQEDLTTLVKAFTGIRSATPGLTNANYNDVFEQNCAGMAPYWTDICRILLVHSLSKQNLHRAERSVIDQIADPLRTVLLRREKQLSAEHLRLEENPVLLQSRANLLRACNLHSNVSLQERDFLWNKWKDKYTGDLSDQPLAKFRDEATRSEDDWTDEILSLKSKQNTLFPEL